MFIEPPRDRVTLRDLPEFFQRRLDAREQVSLSEREHLLSALGATNWNKSKAAELLSWSRMTLYRKMKKYAIAKDLDGRPAGTKSTDSQ